MRRRLLLALGAGALAPLTSFAQAQMRPRLIGRLDNRDLKQYQDAFNVVNRGQCQIRKRGRAKVTPINLGRPARIDEVVVNMKTATALGLKIPYSIMLRATRVIE